MVKLIKRDCCRKDNDSGSVTVIGKMQQIQLKDEETGEPCQFIDCYVVSQDEKYQDWLTTDKDGYLKCMPKDNYNIFILSDTLSVVAPGD